MPVEIVERLILNSIIKIMEQPLIESSQISLTNFFKTRGNAHRDRGRVKIWTMSINITELGYNKTRTTLCCTQIGLLTDFSFTPLIDLAQVHWNSRWCYGKVSTELTQSTLSNTEAAWQELEHPRIGSLTDLSQTCHRLLEIPMEIVER